MSTFQKLLVVALFIFIGYMVYGYYNRYTVKGGYMTDEKWIADCVSTSQKWVMDKFDLNLETIEVQPFCECTLDMWRLNDGKLPSKDCATLCLLVNNYNLYDKIYKAKINKEIK